MTENELSYQIRGAIFEVYNHFGPGLYEQVYEAAMMIELTSRGIARVGAQVPFDVAYKGNPLALGFRMDLLVDDKVIVEIKSVKKLQDVHFKQLDTYLKLTGKKLGILVNFNTADLTKSIHRRVNGLSDDWR